MTISEIIAVIAGILTIIGFVIAMWQTVKLRTAEQALRSIDNICRTALLEVIELYQKEKDPVHEAQYRSVGAYISSALDACWAFLNVKRKQFDDPSQKNLAYVRMGWKTDSQNVDVNPVASFDQAE